MDQEEFRERLVRLEANSGHQNKLLLKIDRKLDAREVKTVELEGRVGKIETHLTWMKGIWAVLQAPVLFFAAWYYSHKS